LIIHKVLDLYSKSNWGKSVVNGVKNAWNTTVQTVKNVGNAISNTVSKAVSTAVSTVKNAVSSVTNAVTNAVKKVATNIKNVVNNIRTNVVEREKVASTTTSDRGDVVSKNSAAVNPKAEKTKELESQLNDLRKLGTLEANLMAEILEQKMKLACESDLERVEITTKNEYVNQLFKDAHRFDWAKDIAYTTGSALGGFGTSIINNTTGLSLSNESFFENYEKVYYGGRITGDIATTIVGAIGMVLGPLAMVTGTIISGGGIAVSATGVGSAPGLAITGIGVGVTAVGGVASVEGQAILGRSSDSLSDNIQKFSESGSTTGQNKIDSNKLNHIFGKEEHGLDQFLQKYKGDKEIAYKAIEDATQKYINANKLKDGIIQEVISVNGTNITVRGNIINGKINIGTAFVAP